LKKYVFRFAAANVVLIFVVAIVAELLKLKSGTGLAVAATLGASIFAAHSFAKDHEREPTAEEKRTFAWWALCASWLVSLAAVAVVAALTPSPGVLNVVRSLNGAFFVIVCGMVFFVSALYYLSIRWSFAWFAKLTAGQRA
jgi:hypothetical protein